MKHSLTALQCTYFLSELFIAKNRTIIYIYHRTHKNVSNKNTYLTKYFPKKVYQKNTYITTKNLQKKKRGE